MKSKMKSAFALIAVALMIMVAVVPMISVFNDSSEAVVVSPTETKTIKVEGKVMDSTNVSIANALVVVTSENVKEYGLTNSSGAFSINVYLVNVDVIDLTVAVVTDEATYRIYMEDLTAVNPAAGREFGAPQEFTGVTKDITGVNFMSGKVTVSGKVTYANAAQPYVNKQVTLYTIDGEQETFVANATTDANGIYTFLVNVDLGKAIVRAEAKSENPNFSVPSEFTITTSNITVNNISSLNEYKVKMTTNLDVEPALTLSKDVEKTRVTELSVPDKVDNVYTFVYKIVPSDADHTVIAIKITDTSGFSKGVPSQTLNGADFTYAYSTYVEGTMKMGTGPSVAIADGNGQFVVTTYKGEEATGVALAVTDNGDGSYVIPYGNVDLGETNKATIKYTYKDATVTNTINISASSTNKIQSNIVLPITGYSSVQGKVTPAIAGVEFAVTGNNNIGLKDGKVTTASNGTFAFYTKTGDMIEVSPVAGTYDYNKKTVNVVSNVTGVDFTMNTVKYSLPDQVAVKDGDGHVLEGISVYYSTNYNNNEGTFVPIPVLTDEDGLFEITVNSNIAKANVYFYLKDSAGLYTFNSSATHAICLSTATADQCKANEVEKTFSLTDAAGEEIRTIGVTVSMALYEVHKTEAGDGTANVFEKVSDVIVMKEDGVYSALIAYPVFITDDAITTEMGQYRYAISITSTMLSPYTFDLPLYIFTENEMEIAANEATFSGTIKDAGNSALKGMSISVVDEDGTVIESGITSLTDGTYSVIADAEKAKAITVVDPAGVYTFNEDGYDFDDYVANAAAAEKKWQKITIKDAANNIIYNADITITAYVEEDGIYYKSGKEAKLDADGTFRIIAANMNKLIVEDNDSVYEFFTDEDNEFVTPDENVITAQNAYMKFTTKAHNYLAGVADEEAMPGVTVTVSQVLEHGDKVKIGEATTYGTDATAKILVNKGINVSVSFKASDSAYTFATLPINNVGAASYNQEVYAQQHVLYKEIDFQKGDDLDYSDIGFSASDYGAVAYEVLASGDYKEISELDIITEGDAYYVAIPVKMTNVPALDGEYKLVIGLLDIISGVSDSAYYTFMDGDSPYIPVTLAVEPIESQENYDIYTVLADDVYGPFEDVVVVFTKANGDTAVFTTDELGRLIVDTTFTGTVLAPAADVYYTPVETIIGTFTFDDDGNVEQDCYKGTIVSPVDGIIISYIATNAAGVVIDQDYATIIGDAYYIVTYADADDIDMDAIAPVGYVAEFDAAGNLFITIDITVGLVTAYITDDIIHVEVIGEGIENVLPGTKVTLTADAGFIDSDGLQTMEYTFAGWYVNGQKVSDDTVLYYTVVAGDSLTPKYTAAIYEEPVPVVPAQDNSIDPTVLIIGICAVVIALIAVAYAVLASRQKKEEQ